MVGLKAILNTHPYLLLLSCLVDKPGPPVNLTVKSSTEDSIVLTWEPPSDDGGSEITRYQVEKRDASKRTWAPVGGTDTTEMTVDGLAKGQTYLFRVAAENQCGVGQFVELEKFVAPQSEFGTNSYILLY